MNSATIIMLVGWVAILLVFWIDFYRVHRRTKRLAKRIYRREK